MSVSNLCLALFTAFLVPASLPGILVFVVGHRCVMLQAERGMVSLCE